MNKKVLSLLLSAAGLVYAQDPDSLPPPKPPFVRNAPAPSAWTITFKPKVTAKAAPAPGNGPSQEAQGAQLTLRAVQVFKAGDTRRMIFTWSNGTKTEKWWLKGLNLVEQPGNTGVLIINLGAVAWLPGNETYSDTDFPEFRWIQASMYAPESADRDPSGMKRPHYLFRAPREATDPAATASSKPLTSAEQALRGNRMYLGKRKGRNSRYGMRAWIDASTKLPIALDDTVNIETFSFDPNPPTSLELPSRFSDQLKKYKEACPVPPPQQFDAKGLD
jgi:hypothetical protein